MALRIPWRAASLEQRVRRPGGKKHEACCWGKGFEWVEDEAGTVFREALEQLRQAFIAKHGREPGPDDLRFPDMPHP